MRASIRTIFRFGDFEVDEARFELRRNGLVEPLQPRVFDLLCAMARRPDAVLSRAELLADVWSGVCVTNDALAQAIMSLRRALGDTRETPRYVETVRGRGYRFLGKVAQGSLPPRATANVPRLGAGLVETAPGRDFVRTAQFDALLPRLEGDGGVVLVTGATGSGKTRFVEALASAAENGLVVRAAPPGAPDLWLFVQLLRALRKRGAALEEPLAAMIDSADPGDLLGTAAERFALSEAILRALEHAAEKAPLLLTCDDLHAEGPGTLAMLEVLAPRLARTRVLLCASYTNSGDLSPAMLGLLGSLQRDPDAAVVRIEPFTVEEVSTFLQEATGATPAPEAVAQIHHKTRGHARLLTQLVQRPSQAWLQAAELTTEALVDAAPLREGVAHPLRSLAPEVRAALTMAAVLGPSFAVAPLAAALGTSNIDTLRALDVASAAGFLNRTAGGYQFVYPVVRDVLHEGLAASERARLHGLAARATEAHLGDGEDHRRVAQVAVHWVEAAVLGDVEAAVDWSLRAATLASVAGDASAARSAAIRGLVAIELSPAPDAAKRARLRAWIDAPRS